MRPSESLLLRLVAGALLAGLPAAAFGQAPADQRLIELEERVQLLETEDDLGPAGLPEWLGRFRISGYAETGLYTGDGDSPVDEGSLALHDLRLFLDVDVASDVALGDGTFARDIGFFIEMNIVRRTEFGTDRFADGPLGEAYADFQGLCGSHWVNLHAGRVLIPVGESYLRYGRGAASEPFISDTLGGPWYWDEGLRLHGADAAARFGYVASVTEGDNEFDGATNQELQFTAKLFAEPTSWLRLSASGLVAGELGSAASPAESALWLGETLPTAFGDMSDLPNFQDGVAVPDGPAELAGVSLIGADVILRPDDRARLWLAYGLVEIDSKDSTAYDRSLHYWIAELVLDGDLFAPSLARFYVGVRGNGLGTYDDSEGYLVDTRLGDTLGYNVASAEAYSLVLGWRPHDRVTLRTEYTFYGTDLVDGVTPDIEAAADDLDTFSVELGIAF